MRGIYHIVHIVVSHRSHRRSTPTFIKRYVPYVKTSTVPYVVKNLCTYAVKISFPEACKLKTLNKTYFCTDNRFFVV